MDFKESNASTRRGRQRGLTRVQRHQSANTKPNNDSDKSRSGGEMSQPSVANVKESRIPRKSEANSNARTSRSGTSGLNGTVSHGGRISTSSKFKQQQSQEKGINPETRDENDVHQRKRGSNKTTVYVGMFKAKILVIGPRESGKTVISNYLADATEISGGDYRPTQGVRILEFEGSSLSVGGKEVSCEVELWDCSGDQKFENCWPAIQKDANGILFVYNPDNASHGKELETLYIHFVQEQGLRDNQCMLFAHSKPGSNARKKSHFETPPYLSKIPRVETNLEDDSDVVREKFNELLAVLLRNWADRRDQEELSIMNN